MILVAVLDGLRPDYITSETTPFLYEMSQRGVFCSNSHAVFPTATRINSASLATGCYPGRHGIVDNELYIPSLDSQRTISCADWRALRHMAQEEGGRLLEASTMGELLRQAGKSMVSAGSGSPGTTYLMNPELTGPIVNWAVAWPDRLMNTIIDSYGGMLDETSDTGERHRFVLDILEHELVPRHQPNLITLWLTEPDHAQHEHGIGSPQALAALAEVDTLIDELYHWLEAHCEQAVTCFILSDHGFSTVHPRVDPTNAFIQAGLKESRTSNDVLLPPCNSIYIQQSALDRLDAILRFLATQDWIGAIAVRDDLADSSGWPVRQSAFMGGHRRSPEILFSYAWSHRSNAYSAAGSVAQSTQMAAVHGSSSPYDINNSLIAWGPNLKSGQVSNLPCAIVDIAPTVLHLLGVEKPDTMDGRILYELLQDGPPLRADKPSSQTKHIPLIRGQQQVYQDICYTSFDDSVYLDEASLRREA